MKRVTKKFYQDAGHGWLAVKAKELRDLGIADKISSCSYMKGLTVYLEEDLDAETYILAQRDAGVGVDFIINHTKFNKPSPIRSYRMYHKSYNNGVSIK